MEGRGGSMIRVRFMNVGRHSASWEKEFPTFDAEAIAAEAMEVGQIQSSELCVHSNKEHQTTGIFTVGDCVGFPRLIGLWRIIGGSD